MYDYIDKMEDSIDEIQDFVESARFRVIPDNSNPHGFELHRPSNKGTKLLLKVIKAIIIINLKQESTFRLSNC